MSILFGLCWGHVGPCGGHVERYGGHVERCGGDVGRFRRYVEAVWKPCGSRVEAMSIIGFLAPHRWAILGTPWVTLNLPRNIIIYVYIIIYI